MFRLQGYHLLWPDFPDSSTTPTDSFDEVLQPQSACRLVWAVPVSLAATKGIAFAFFSSGYLDVSIPRVRLPFGMTGHYPRRVPPFGHLRITACFLLPEEFRW